MADLADPFVVTLFDEGDFDDAYYRKRSEAAFGAVLDATGWAVRDVVAVAEPFALLVIGKAGFVECQERGGFKKRTEVEPIVPWGDVLEAEKTEPTLRVYGIRLTIQGEEAPRAYTWSGRGSEKDRQERDRVYRFLAGG